MKELIEESRLKLEKNTSKKSLNFQQPPPPSLDSQKYFGSHFNKNFKKVPKVKTPAQQPVRELTAIDEHTHEDTKETVKTARSDKSLL